MELKRYLPPVLTDFIRKSQRVIKYKSYEEALSYCTNEGYHNEELCRMIADKTLVYIESLKKAPFTLNPTTVYLVFALNYFINSSGKKNITVLDFGGACGVHYYEVRNLLPETTSLKWIVVETEQMVLSAKTKGLANAELSFIPHLENVTASIDFVYSSSTLQYVSDPYALLQNLTALKASTILFNRMLFNSTDEDIITVQRSLLSANGPGKLPLGYNDRSIKYPHFAMSFDKMNSVMNSNGYKCLSEFDESSGKISLGNTKTMGKGLLYVLKA